MGFGKLTNDVRTRHPLYIRVGHSFFFTSIFHSVKPFKAGGHKDRPDLNI